MTRQEANRKILKILSEAVEKYDDWRFGQILFNFAVIKYDLECDPVSGDIDPFIKDPFNQESTETLKQMYEELATK